jgi:hypothetical protein
MVHFHEWFDIFSVNAGLPITSGTIVNAFISRLSAAMLEFLVSKACSRTLRNMWAVVEVFPVIALLLICIIPLAQVGRTSRITTFLGQKNWWILVSILDFN